MLVRSIFIKPKNLEHDMSMQKIDLGEKHSRKLSYSIDVTEYM